MTTTLSPSTPPVRTLTPVLDCPECVWNDFGATGLDLDFVREWSSAIHAAGAEAVRPHLITAWRKRGYLAELVCHHTCAKVGARRGCRRSCCTSWRRKRWTRWTVASFWLVRTLRASTRSGVSADASPQR